MKLIDLKSAADWANFWYYIRNVNVMPYDTKNRIPIIETYKIYQNNRIPVKTFENWKKERLFEKGMAIFPGKIYTNEFENLYLVALDFDTINGIKEFCSYFSKNTSLNELANMTIVEQHLDNPHRAHCYMLSPIPFPNKGSDHKLGLEVKSKGEHGIMFCTNSTHKNGSQYQIMGTKEPLILTKIQAIKMIQHIYEICKKHGLEFLDNQVIKNPLLKRMIKSLKINKNQGFGIHEGERHNSLISIANSILFNHLVKDESNIDRLRTFFEEINNNYCFPDPIPSEEIDSIWDSCVEYVRANKDFDTVLINKKPKSEQENEPGLIELATEMILEKYNFLTLEESKEVLYYQNGVYVPGGNIIIEKEAEKIFGYELANKDLTEIKGHIMRKTYHKSIELDNDLDIINLQNGLYSITKNELKQHNPTYLSINQKPIAYDPEAKPKLFGKFLKDVLYPQEIRMAIEAMAYTFYSDYPYEYYFKLFGYGSNGKSVFTALLTSLHGKRNVSNASVKSLIENRFALADLEFKDINIDSEYSDISIKDTSILKKLTGGRKQPMRIERKNQHAYDTNLYAKLFFNANSLNERIEKTNADYRREVIINFPNTFEGKKDDPHLLNKLEKGEEVSGIFNILIIALRRILKNKGLFMNEKTIEERRKKSERVADPIKSFIEDAVAEDSTETDWISKTDFHNAYTTYCKRHKIAVKPIEIFARDLAKIRKFDQQKKTINGERKMGWLGIELNPHYLKPEEQRLLTDLC